MLNPHQVNELVTHTLPEGLRERFASEREANFALSRAGKGRFRVSAFQQRNQMAMVVRSIAVEIPRLEALGVPEQLAELAQTKRGLVLVVGAREPGSRRPWRRWFSSATKPSAAILSVSKTRLSTCIPISARL
ncbi:hypothetical protein HORIV_05160 [Vreelandella olivaria]|uniref:Uncharacterized protein n=1 Tax=Vreelandella olivaria TaxID=390919 RepID=A0ABM7GCC3_9GAMM|nr:hypothetical protein HORIV_05160 [Halomonas olivaria]